MRVLVASRANDSSPLDVDVKKKTFVCVGSFKGGAQAVAALSGLMSLKTIYQEKPREMNFRYKLCFSVRIKNGLLD